MNPLGKFISAAFVLAALALVVPRADARGYLGYGFSFLSFDDGITTVKPRNLSLRAGYEINKKLALGAEISRSINADSLGPVEYDIDNRFAFLQLNQRYGETVTAYLMVGTAAVALKRSGANGDARLEDSGVGVGVGLRRPLHADASNLAIEYIRYYSDREFDGISADVNVDALSFSVRYYF